MNMKKFAAGALILLTFSGSAYAAKWKELVFSDADSGMAELEQYCMTHDVTVADVLWANSIDSADIKPGQSLYLPANHAELLAIWQHKGAWQPTALVPVTSAAAAKRAAKKDSLLKEVPMPKIAGIPDLNTLTPKPEPLKSAKPAEIQTVAAEPEKTAETPAPAMTQKVSEDTALPVKIAEAKSDEKSNDDIIAMLRDEVKADSPDAEAGNSAETPAPDMAQAQPEDTAPPAEIAEAESDGKTNDDIIAMLRDEVKANERNLPPEPEKPAEIQTAKTDTEDAKPEKTAETPAPVQQVKTAKSHKQESPAKVIANTAKPDKILTSRGRKSAKAEIPGLMDPIIIFSPNGDPSQGPMRLVISGDKVEVVQLPKNAAPKRPSLSDLNDSFGTNPSYLPHYNLTPKRRDPFILNMGNLAGKMLWPVEGKVSSPFGKWRGSHRHQGIDIPMPAGTPIRAARNGVISRTGNNSTMGFRGYGNFVLMDHGEGLQTFYAHCLSVAVVQGQRVMQGQIIGYVGSTGRSTANHLHFEVRINSTKVDPMRYLAGNTQFASTN
ncbi:MAG: peptidoglycan DD-metalloendopeptidase family protein [Synergistaceae bacterium]|nr:peptidoglycan DD-metalloendopeptidase family protein [Synergistaceae bacterium]